MMFWFTWSLLRWLISSASLYEQLLSGLLHLLCNHHRKSLQSSAQRLDCIHVVAAICCAGLTYLTIVFERFRGIGEDSPTIAMGFRGVGECSPTIGRGFRRVRELRGTAWERQVDHRGRRASRSACSLRR